MNLYMCSLWPFVFKYTYHQFLFAIFSYWKSLMFHSDKMNTLLLPRPAAEVHFPKQCLKTCRPTNSMSKFQRCLLQRNILVLRGYNCMLLAHRPYCTVTLNSNYSYLKNLKLFTIRVKELSEPIVLWRKGDGFLPLFISIFLRNRSLSDARWFYGKKRKIGKGNLYLTEYWLSWNEMYCASDNHNYICQTWAKEFLNSSFN